MASEGEPKRTGNVFRTLARLGHRGPNYKTCQAVFEQAASAGMDLASLFTRLGATRDWPPPGTREWTRLRAVALRAILTSLAREGRLDCISTSPDEVREMGGESLVPGIGVQVARSMFRRVDRNGPGSKFRCVKRDTPLKVILRWASSACPDLGRKTLMELADELRTVQYVDEDGHIRGADLLNLLMQERDAACDHPDEMIAVADFDDAIDSLRRVFKRLSIL